MEPATLSLDLERRAEDIHEPEFAAYAPLVGFEAFLSAQRLFGWVRLDATRLTDLLNAHDLVQLTNVLVEEHRDGSVVLADETVIPRAEIIAVIARGPRGDPSRRLKTHTHAVVIHSGAYQFGGLVHVPSGMRVEQRLREGGPMVPLTEAWLQYHAGARHRQDTAKTVIVNYASATHLELVSESAALERPPKGISGSDRFRPYDSRLPEADPS
jgi:hypothetical protein